MEENGGGTGGVGVEVIVRSVSEWEKGFLVAMCSILSVQKW